MVDEFTIFTETLKKHFVFHGYMDVDNYEAEKHVLIITSWINPLNIKKLLNSNTQSIFLEEMKLTESELIVNAPKRNFFVNTIASNLFVLSSDGTDNGTDLNLFLKLLIDTYIEFATEYFEDSQDIIEMYDKFEVLSYWSSSPVRNHSCYNIIHTIIQKYLCVECSEIVCESSFRKAKLAKCSLRRNLSGSTLSDVMFLLENKDLSYDCITKSYPFYVVFHNYC